MAELSEKKILPETIKEKIKLIEKLIEETVTPNALKQFRWIQAVLYQKDLVDSFLHSAGMIELILKEQEEGKTIWSGRFGLAGQVPLPRLPFPASQSK